MDSTADFETWLSGFLRWRAEAAKLLGQRLPADAVALIAEKQQLEPMRFEAEEWRADGIGFYYAQKLKQFDMMEDMDIARTARGELAKAQCHRQLWAKERTQGICDAVTSRGFKVDSELKRLGIDR